MWWQVRILEWLRDLLIGRIVSITSKWTIHFFLTSPGGIDMYALSWKGGLKNCVPKKNAIDPGLRSKKMWCPVYLPMVWNRGTLLSLKKPYISLWQKKKSIKKNPQTIQEDATSLWWYPYINPLLLVFQLFLSWRKPQIFYICWVSSYISSFKHPFKSSSGWCSTRFYAFGER